MPNLSVSTKLKLSEKSFQMTEFSLPVILKKIDLICRFLSAYKFNFKNNFDNFRFIFLAAMCQVFFEYLPFVAWFTWPFLVYLSVQTVVVVRPENIGYFKYIASIFSSLKAKGEVLIALALYAGLSLIIFRALMEFFIWLKIESAYIPDIVLTLLPFTASQAFAYLFIAQCASHLSVDDRDPFNVLNLSTRDLVLSPMSTLTILILQSTLLSYFAVTLSVHYKMPNLSTFLGHAPFAFLVLIWVCGQPKDKQPKSWIENLK